MLEPLYLALLSRWTLCLQEERATTCRDCLSSIVIVEARGQGSLPWDTPCRPGPLAFLRVAHVLLGAARFQSPLKSVAFLEAYPALLDRRSQAAALEDYLDSSGSALPCPLPPLWPAQLPRARGRAGAVPGVAAGSSA